MIGKFIVLFIYCSIKEESSLSTLFHYFRKFKDKFNSLPYVDYTENQCPQDSSNSEEISDRRNLRRRVDINDDKPSSFQQHRSLSSRSSDILPQVIFTLSSLFAG